MRNIRKMILAVLTAAVCVLAMGSTKIMGDEMAYVEADRKSVV